MRLTNSSSMAMANDLSWGRTALNEIMSFPMSVDPNNALLIELCRIIKPLLLHDSDLPGNNRNHLISYPKRLAIIHSTCSFSSHHVYHLNFGVDSTTAVSEESNIVDENFRTTAGFSYSIWLKMSQNCYAKLTMTRRIIRLHSIFRTNRIKWSIIWTKARVRTIRFIYLSQAWTGDLRAVAINENWSYKKGNYEAGR